MHRKLLSGLLGTANIPPGTPFFVLYHTSWILYIPSLRWYCVFCERFPWAYDTKKLVISDAALEQRKQSYSWFLFSNTLVREGTIFSFAYLIESCNSFYFLIVQDSGDIAIALSLAPESSYRLSSRGEKQKRPSVTAVLRMQAPVTVFPVPAWCCPGSGSACCLPSAIHSFL